MACGPAVAVDPGETEAGSDGSSGDSTGTGTSTGPVATSTSVTTQVPEGGTTGPSDETGSGSGGSTSESSGGAVRCGSPATDPDDVLGVASRPLQGDPDAVVTIVEWLGYEDPFSRMAEPKMHTLLEGEHAVRRVVRQLPFMFHPNARMLAEAAVASAAQDAFWALHDALMEFEGTIDAPALDVLAEEAGLDVEQLHADMSSDATQAILDEDEALLVDIIDTGLTPAFFINGRRVDGNQPLDVFEQHVAEEADATQALLDEGYTLCEAYAQRLEHNLP
jgi:protein-disulfide isomerase